ESSKIAKEMAKDALLLKVQHHYTHILSTMAEYDITQKVLGFAFDGSGLGDDGCVWGGEVFKCDAKGYERVYHFKYFKLIGSTKAIKDAKRVVLGLLFEHYSFEEVLEFEVAKRYTREELKMLHNVWEKSINSPLTSSVGRLFDAVSIMGGFLDDVNYDGEAGLVLESFYDKGIKESYNYTIKNGEIEIDMISILKDSDKHLIASKFLNTLADIVLSISKNSKLPVVLSGGVFQNTTLLNLVVDGFRKNSIIYYISKEIALNDEGISLGQMWYGLHFVTH
ncbi:MAG: carbamoyltransferase HypF, partial [Campylobacterales bacterium]|nr:carbamoyltransferase HypF [Campylobacterales bacterium]